MAKSKKAGKGIAIFIAIIIGIVIVGGCSSWITGWTITGSPDMSKWNQATSDGAKDDENGSDDEAVTPLSEGALVLQPLTTLDSPVAIAAETTGLHVAKLTATISPENGVYHTVTWRSSSSKVTVTQDEEDPLKATVTCAGYFSDEVTITCVVVSTKTLTATCKAVYLAFPLLSDLTAYLSGGVIKFGDTMEASINCNANLPSGAMFLIKDYSIEVSSEFAHSLQKTGFDFSSCYDEAIEPYARNCTISMPATPFDAFGGVDANKEEALKAFFKATNTVQNDKLVPLEAGILKLNVVLTYNGVQYKSYSVENTYCFDNSYITEITDVTIEQGEIVFSDSDRILR